MVNRIIDRKIYVTVQSVRGPIDLKKYPSIAIWSVDVINLATRFSYRLNKWGQKGTCQP